RAPSRAGPVRAFLGGDRLASGYDPGRTGPTADTSGRQGRRHRNPKVKGFGPLRTRDGFHADLGILTWLLAFSWLTLPVPAVPVQGSGPGNGSLSSVG